MTHNTHITPVNAVPLDAFNLVPGAAFMVVDKPDHRVFIVEQLVRDEVAEIVFGVAHDGTDAEHAAKTPFLFNYCQKVALVGIVVNPQDDNDNNWGNS